MRRQHIFAKRRLTIYCFLDHQDWAKQRLQLSWRTFCKSASKCAVAPCSNALVILFPFFRAWTRKIFYLLTKFTACPSQSRKCCTRQWNIFVLMSSLVKALVQNQLTSLSTHSPSSVQPRKQEKSQHHCVAALAL